ncbi:DMT family transporter [Tepidamorphus sp. 3E244]|uniref:DMT family transporter n=1 Tax=Tepidamorphus sp. 3E244 TaxID=3385498 RepID=UPI0038FBE8C6
MRSVPAGFVLRRVMRKDPPAIAEPSTTAAPPAALGLLFILIWSTGFIVARAQAPFGEPLTFVALRFALAALFFAIIVIVTGRSMAVGRRAAANNLVAGALLHGVYLGSVFSAINIGMPVGVASLIQSTAPIFTAVLAGPLLGERVVPRQWLGLCISLAGVALTLSPKLGETGFTLLPIAISLFGLTGLVFGGFYQRLYVSKVDLQVANVYQYVGGTLIVLPVMFAFETVRLVTHPVYLAAMGWAVIVLSVGAFSLYIHFLRRGAVTKAASLMFLVPAIASLQAWLIFGETLTPLQITGGLVTLAGLAVAQRA